MGEIPPMFLRYTDGTEAKVDRVESGAGEIHIIIERPKKPPPPRPVKLPHHEEIRRLLLLADLPNELHEQIRGALFPEDAEGQKDEGNRS